MEQPAKPREILITRKFPHHPIEGTEKRSIPKWIKRKDLNHFVRYHSDRGYIPIDNFKKEIRITSIAGKRLTRTQVDDLFKHAAVWQKLLLKETSVAGTYTFFAPVEQANTVVVNSTDGHASRDSQDNSSGSKTINKNLHRREGLSLERTHSKGKPAMAS